MYNGQFIKIGVQCQAFTLATLQLPPVAFGRGAEFLPCEKKKDKKSKNLGLKSFRSVFGSSKDYTNMFLMTVLFVDFEQIP